MGVQHKISDAALQFVVFIIAISCMFMDAQGIGGAKQRRYGRNLGELVTGVGMQMSVITAYIFRLHGNGRQNQRVCGYKNNHRGQDHGNSFPNTVPAVSLLIVLRCVAIIQLQGPALLSQKSQVKRG